MSQFSDSDSSSTSDLILLAIGDVHLGIRPSSLPENFDNFGVERRAITPECALESAVDHAIRARVDAVLFAGDVVEGKNALFEAFRPLELAVRQLIEAKMSALEGQLSERLADRERTLQSRVAELSPAGFARFWRDVECTVVV